jgi:hypothetical protein
MGFGRQRAKNTGVEKKALARKRGIPPKTPNPDDGTKNQMRSRENQQKLQEESREQARRSESVNGYGRGFGSFLTGQEPARDTTPETTGGGKEVAPNEAEEERKIDPVPTRTAP